MKTFFVTLLLGPGIWVRMGTMSIGFGFEKWSHSDITKKQDITKEKGRVRVWYSWIRVGLGFS